MGNCVQQPGFAGELGSPSIALSRVQKYIDAAYTTVHQWVGLHQMEVVEGTCHVQPHIHPLGARQPLGGPESHVQGGGDELAENDEAVVDGEPDELDNVWMVHLNEGVHVFHGLSAIFG